MLLFAALDEDMYGSDWLGEHRLPLANLVPNCLTDHCIALGARKPGNAKKYVSLGNQSGLLSLNEAGLKRQHHIDIHVKLRPVNEGSELLFSFCIRFTSSQLFTDNFDEGTQQNRLM
ncbi:unnamed protein product [Protopolystoma xenopodis]|uniref:Uncharacterized protein n=1 Tax=Protopolystoma xenopodis TaxID=117903 RepID=A0A448WJU4_9PLAT|nr:unnamed protein product [Protopolystoma xenopodis]